MVTGEGFFGYYLNTLHSFPLSRFPPELWQIGVVGTWAINQRINARIE